MQLIGAQEKIEQELVEEQGDPHAKGLRLTPQRMPLTCLCVDSKGHSVFTGSKDGSIVKWCLQSNKLVAKVAPITKKQRELDKSLEKKHHMKHVNCIAISSDDKFLATG